MFIIAFGGGGCWGGGGGGAIADAGHDSGVVQQHAIDAGKPAGVRIEASSSYGSAPNYVITGKSAKVQVWTDSAYGRASQVLYTSTDNAVKTRVVFDSQLGAPSMIIDEVTGKYLSIVESKGRIDFLEYAKDNTYQRGFAIVSSGSTYQMGTIAGKPAFEGQLQGQLTSTATTNTGSFAVIASQSTTLTGLKDVSTELNAILTASAGKSAVTSYGGIGVSTSPLISVSRALRWGGLVVGGAGLLAGLPAYGAAGVAMVFAGYFANDVASFIEQKFASQDPYAQELVDLAVSNLRDASSVGLTDILKKASTLAQNLVGGSASTPSGGLNDVSFENVSSYTGTTDNSLGSSSLPVPVGGPPPISVSVGGQAVWQDNTAYQVQGTVDANGKLTVNGAGPAANDQLTIDGTIDTTKQLTGSYSRTQVLPAGNVQTTGTATGTVTAVAQCQAVQASGGQGTFTNVHYVGGGGGTSTFSYDAYSIPDAFTVSVAGQSVYTTGGLVSGTGTSPIATDQSGFVFVSVSAPQSGTSWEYSLTCL